MDASRENRRAALGAMSELFLDTEHDDESLAYIARRLKVTGLSEQGLDTMFYRQVEPVLAYSIFEGPGRWPAFDIDWLEAKIARRERSWLWRMATRLRRPQKFSADLWRRVMSHWRAA
jgi:hypothetical protein